jgi:CheY-specific phosphatase CheX
LPIGGPRPLKVAVSSDHAGAQALSCAMFSMTIEEIDESMINDSLSELANIVAGQVKAMLGVNHALGLPRMVAASGDHVGNEGWRSATMRSGSAEVHFWVAVGE